MSDTSSPPSMLTVGSGDQARDIAMLVREADQDTGPALIWLGGYRSDMTGTKAQAMEAVAARLGLKAVRFDYSGHGASGGAFRDGTISRWLEESLAVIDHAGVSDVVLVGSSMGGWIALRLAQEIARRGQGPKISGLALIAPAPDFTAELIEPHLTDSQKASLAERGFFEETSQYSPEPNIYTRALIEDGRNNRIMAAPLQIDCPIHILQGMNDADVPYGHALKLMEYLPSDDVVLTLIRDGDHRLSRPQDLERLEFTLEILAKPK
ncbi:alpha/beta hydrolase [Rhizobium halophytocola]|uniref:Palmitoyl-protein thioesterase ABHD10, mitochondrial n=1 Tax=Rhizobium halophytocola TaxID=735519 RepID=A0ABS4DZX3_9HYPH|nr:alpha/beta hydrolase [Rhizobium halophytocola]MBP1851237.1 pimeloyl-ACP methyl ester carboxylesterase [Rhizobium halophytocola]